jgi:hypothetical protein
MPVYIETHRASIMQDAWRTTELIRRIPQVRFNGDFSHWLRGRIYSTAILTQDLIGWLMYLKESDFSMVV